MASSNDSLARLKRRFLKLPQAVREAVSRSTVEGAEEIAQSMRALVPVDEGDLRSSITVTPGGRATPPHSQPGGSYMVPEYGAVVTAGNTDVRYAHLVEYGTAAARAQPFFWPAVRSKRKRVANRITRRVSKVIREEWKKK